MSMTLTRSKGDAAAKAPRGGAPRSLPQINLLPPEVRIARGLRVVKRWLAISLIAVIVVLGGLYALVGMGHANAKNDLATTQAETRRLIKEQLKHVEVPMVVGELANVQLAREFAGSTDIDWEGYLRAVDSTVPKGVSLDLLSVTGATPLQGADGPVDPLQRPSIARITFTARSLTVPDTQAWIERLNAVPGLADAWFSAMTVNEEDGVDYFVVTSSVQVSSAAYTHRFDVPAKGK